MKNTKNNKAITLIALVITIVVLIILATVTISMVLGNNGLVNKAKEGIDNYQAAANEEYVQINKSDEEWEELIPKPIYAITYNANGGSGEMTPTIGKKPQVVENTFTRTNYIFKGWNTSADGTGTSIAVGTIASGNTTLYAQWYKNSYSVGETVTLGGETFYVIEDSDPSKTTVTLLAALNVITTAGNENRYKQDPNANNLRFDDNSNDYGSSEIKPHVVAYKEAVEGRMGEGKTIQEARLMSLSEVQALGGSSLFHSSNYWLGTINGNMGNAMYCVAGSSNTFSIVWSTDYGLRPVVVVLKSYI